MDPAIKLVLAKVSTLNSRFTITIQYLNMPIERRANPLIRPLQSGQEVKQEVDMGISYLWIGVINTWALLFIINIIIRCSLSFSYRQFSGGIEIGGQLSSLEL